MPQKLATSSCNTKLCWQRAKVTASPKETTKLQVLLPLRRSLADTMDPRAQALGQFTGLGIHPPKPTALWFDLTTALSGSVLNQPVVLSSPWMTQKD